MCTAYQNFLVPMSPDRSRLYEWGYFNKLYTKKKKKKKIHVFTYTVPENLVFCKNIHLTDVPQMLTGSQSSDS